MRHACRRSTLSRLRIACCPQLPLIDHAVHALCHCSVASTLLVMGISKARHLRCWASHGTPRHALPPFDHSPMPAAALLQVMGR